MKIYFKGRWWTFRECDIKDMTEAEVIQLADQTGKIQYEPNGHVWLHVKGVGYGWEVKNEVL